MKNNRKLDRRYRMNGFDKLRVAVQLSNLALRVEFVRICNAHVGGACSPEQQGEIANSSRLQAAPTDQLTCQHLEKTPLV